MKKNADQPAFPNTNKVVEKSDQGLTKREYLAAKALQGLMTGNQTSSVILFTENKFIPTAQQIIKAAINAADMLLAEHEKSL